MHKLKLRVLTLYCPTRRYIHQWINSKFKCELNASQLGPWNSQAQPIQLERETYQEPEWIPFLQAVCGPSVKAAVVPEEKIADLWWQSLQELTKDIRQWRGHVDGLPRWRKPDAWVQEQDGWNDCAKNIGEKKKWLNFLIRIGLRTINYYYWRYFTLFYEREK